ncbi:hypothetical protein L873DRAFT_1151779 [Choiromyces venosus 120613-1]|uniref:Uncharacterized protein n=1 Tax=Choiromyces venosus 120613-1 TaxID=1336337 RepID=A0A3N4JFZ4_9PEZI|nr:hypothetical protein L873DRAFT_1151779 [Choiromyces venosus 120613-1]
MQCHEIKKSTLYAIETIFLSSPFLLGILLWVTRHATVTLYFTQNVNLSLLRFLITTHILPLSRFAESMATRRALSHLPVGRTWQSPSPSRFL